jgi:hypothetical protein
MNEGFICKEGVCYGAGIGDCVLNGHKKGIEAYHKLRQSRFNIGLYKK